MFLTTHRSATTGHTDFRADERRRLMAWADENGLEVSIKPAGAGGHAGAWSSWATGRAWRIGPSTALTGTFGSAALGTGPSKAAKARRWRSGLSRTPWPGSLSTPKRRAGAFAKRGHDMERVLDLRVHHKRSRPGEGASFKPCAGSPPR